MMFYGHYDGDRGKPNKWVNGLFLVYWKKNEGTIPCLYKRKKRKRFRVLAREVSGKRSDIATSIHVFDE